MKNRITSPFRVVLFFAALVLAGWLLIPRLKVDLLPRDKTSSLTVAFSLPNSSPHVVEQRVTSVIEGVTSQLNQLKNISSVSGYHGGYVQLEFDKGTDMQFKQFELASMIRQVYAKLPASASYPVIISAPAAHTTEAPLLTYSIIAPLQPFRIKQQAENVFRTAFTGIPGVKEVKLSGTENLQLTIRFDKEKCEAWSVDPDGLISSMQSYFAPSYPGSVSNAGGEQFFLQVQSPAASVTTIENILLPLSNGQCIRLKDVAAVYIEEQEPQGYFRINGKNSISLNIYARNNENRIIVGNAAKTLVATVLKQLPKDFEVRLDYDDTEFIRKEIDKNYRRMALSAGILVIFIALAYRNWRHMLTLVSGLFVSLSLTAIFAWLFGVDIHLYSIAGLAISFGIMADNIIVMLDHYRNRRNRKVFLALLGATLTTISALCLIFFLPEQEKKNLTDFSIVIVLALISSLITSLWFVSAMFEITASLPSPRGEPGRWKRLRKKIAAYGAYFTVVRFIAGYRKIFVALLVLALGLPVFLLPDKWEGDKWYHKWYNATIGTENYQQGLKPGVDRCLGGSLRLFVNNVYEKSGYRSPEKTKLYVNAELPYGNTAEQLNDILADVEKYLSTVDGIDKYVTNVFNGQNGLIEISFKEKHDNTVLSYQLKSRLVARSSDWGGVTWNIYGVGKGFSNAGNDEVPGFRVIMRGYNFDELENQAGRLAGKLEKYKRIQKINTNERLDNAEQQSKEYVLGLDEMQTALHNTNKAEILSSIRSMSKPTGASGQVSIDHQYYPVVLKEKASGDYAAYALLHHAVKLDTARSIRIDNLGTFTIQRLANNIHRNNRQYIRVVSFEYMGASENGNEYLKETLNEMRREMPVGYAAERQVGSWDEALTNRRYVLIASLILAIFFICSVLFENLREPFFIISMIPVSFIGLFLIFSLGGYYFDQGGYAAFVMLGGLVSNAAIFIVNDFNNLRKNKPTASYNRLLIKAAFSRSGTILLTTISTCCGLIPFLMEGQQEVFWFSLAIGTIGGLLFSLFAVFVVLPVLLWRKLF